jgi:ParB family transcriptional regulator, chromosome partitioning protein
MPVTADNQEALKQVPLAEIEPASGQPRFRFPQTELMELAASIKRHGLLQPLVVSTKEGGGYRLIAGERRLRAAKLAGLSRVPVFRRSAEAHQRFELALIENLQRADLSPIEEARAYGKLLADSRLTQDQLAKRLGKRRSQIAQALRLLKLSPTMQGSLERGEISPGHSQALLGRAEPARTRLFRLIIERGLTVRQAESWRSAKARTGAPPAKRPPWLHQLELSLGLQVEQKGTARQGRLVISYHSAEELDTLVDRLSEPQD